MAAKGMFDPNSFLSQKIEQELDTVIIPCPEGDYVGIISKLDVRTWTKKDDPTVTGVNLDILVKISNNENVLEECGVDEITVRGGIKLDIDDTGKSLAFGKGKNVSLGKVMEAAGLNDGDSDINSLLNQPILVRVKHEVIEDVVYAKITRFADPSELAD